MGQTLSEPVTDKHSSSGSSSALCFGASAMQGWRINMEDAHTTLLNLPDDPDAAFFAVYDGHGGATVAKFAGEAVHSKVTKTQAYKEGDIAGALQQGFLETDQHMLNDANLRYETSGCTAVAVVIKNGHIYCGNAGDSRAVASRGGKAVPLSHDHKPNNEGEAKRITSAGGFVDFGRVNGNLALSRAIGDFEFKSNSSLGPKEQAVTAFPDVIKEDVTDDMEFIVLACDGIWDVLNNQQVVNFVRERIAEGLPLNDVCEQLMHRCLAPDSRHGIGCDNMTVIIVGFLNNEPYENLVQRCSQPAVGNISEESPEPAERDFPLFGGSGGGGGGFHYSQTTVTSERARFVFLPSKQDEEDHDEDDMLK